MATRQTSTTTRRKTPKGKVTKKTVSFSLEEDQGLLSAIEITLDDGEFDSFNALCRHALSEFLFEEDESDRDQTQAVVPSPAFDPSEMGVAIAQALQTNLQANLQATLEASKSQPRENIDAENDAEILGGAIAQQLMEQLKTTLLPQIEESQPTINIDIDSQEIGMEVAQKLLPTLQNAQERTITEAVHEAIVEEGIVGGIGNKLELTPAAPTVATSWEEARGEIIAGVATQLEAKLREKDRVLGTLLEEVRSLPRLMQELKNEVKSEVRATVPAVAPKPEENGAIASELVADRVVGELDAKLDAKLDAIEAAISQKIPVIPPEPETPAKDIPEANDQNIDRLAAFLEQF